ncbi:MAG: hypothetical protein OEW68_07910 [Gammaproteobacteria bacterium]|nr:hypothetical protein [Gammaproteobacteria bacterium]MDH4314750.1 hypothetical protein [Gammaproteobacteria bacterium]MDH5212836.1 hypothetical protein [Gammaproteobacteria bacterium]MDH5499520.1 hypothetical protein [Gammaproteobacteria bacterium]
MIRLLGFIVGSAVSIGAILLILGMPEFHLSNPHLDKSRFDEALQSLKEKQRQIEMAAVPVDESPPEPIAASPTISDDDVAIVADSTPGAADTMQHASIENSIDDVLPVEPLQERHWHSFWNPFRSEIAARGFVSQLERVTGLDYRVVKVKTGVYEVAFAYDSDLERQAKLSKIQAATGLDLPGS